MEVGRRVQVDVSNLVGCRLYSVEGLVFSAVATSYCIAAGRAVKGRSLSHTGGILPHQRSGGGEVLFHLLSLHLY
jgi:hypothetical protein